MDADDIRIFMNDTDIKEISLGTLIEMANEYKTILTFDRMILKLKNTPEKESRVNAIEDSLNKIYRELDRREEIYKSRYDY